MSTVFGRGGGILVEPVSGSGLVSGRVKLEY